MIYVVPLCYLLVAFVSLFLFSIVCYLKHISWYKYVPVCMHTKLLKLVYIDSTPDMLSVEISSDISNEDQGAKIEQLISSTSLKEINVKGWAIQRSTHKINPILKCVGSNYALLEVVSLDRCHINNEEATELCRLFKNCKQLHTLTLNENELSLGAMKPLAEVLMASHKLDQLSIGMGMHCVCQVRG